MSPEFLSLNPNNKIPAILDPNGPGGKPLALFESGAILIYLADKTGQLMPRDAAGRYETHPVADVPDGRHRADVRPGRLLPQVRRQGLRGQAPARPLRRRSRGACSACSNERLASARWIMGDDYTIADIATFPWVRNLIGFYDAGELVGIATFRTSSARSTRSSRGRRCAGLEIPRRGTILTDQPEDLANERKRIQSRASARRLR